MEYQTKQFASGCHNLLNNENIPKDACFDEKNFITRDGKVTLARGRALLGAEGVSGAIHSLWYGYKTNGDKVLYRKTGTKIQYWNVTTWTDIITGLLATDDYAFANYSSLAGSFTFINGAGGFWKINNANPGSAMSMYDSTKNFHGKIIIDCGRFLLWDRNDAGQKDKTGLYASKIDPQNATVYTTVSAEVLGAFGLTTFTGHLAFKGAVAARGTFTVAGGGNKIVDGVTSTLGTKTYTFKTALTPTEGEILIGANDTAALVNFLRAINHTGTPDTDYKCAAVHPTVTAISSDATNLIVEAKTKGTIGNSIVSTETGADTSWNGTTLGTTVAGSDGTATRNCFGLIATGTVTAGTETFKDDFNGTLTGSRGGTGTINYATGAYSITFSGATTSGNITVNYQWEDSNIKGITDFTKSAPRVGGDGFQFPQDEGGDAILNVLIGQDGAYYSMKSQSVYRLFIDQSDSMGSETSNKVYRKDLGIPYWRACISTSKGIVFMNTANPENPELTILQRNPLGDNIEPYALLTHFDFTAYDYSKCCIDTFDRYILVACSKGGVYNDTILLCDLTYKTVDIIGYASNVFAKDGGNLYLGSPITESVYQIFNGWDDDGYAIDNFWISRGEKYAIEKLKKTKKLRFKGLISPQQSVEVYVSYDDDGFSLAGTIYGRAEYVDTGNPQTVGNNMIGTELVGGGEMESVCPYFMEIKLKSPKFRKRSVKLVAVGIGYFDMNFLEDFNILMFDNRLPKRFRQKQNVNIQGTLTDQ